jgi:hypothetical protein
MTRRTLIPILCALLVTAGCNVHEVPEGGDEHPYVSLTLHLSLPQDLPQFRTVEYASKAEDRPSGGLDARYLIRFYPYVGKDYAEIPVHEFSFEAAELKDQTFTVDVLPLDYHVEVWADHAGCYSAGDFKAVEAVTEPYAGGSNRRDAFCGATDLVLSGYKENINWHESSMILHRPNGRFNIVATDKDQFLKFWAAQLAQRSGSAVKDASLIDLREFRVRIIYPQFLPFVYNLHAGRHIDSVTGVSFETTLQETEDGNVEMGWDWVLANDEKSSVVVSLALYEADGTFISQVDNIQVPLCPGKNTTVKGNLLSSGVHSGISIDPSFDGEYTVIIN